MALQLVVLAVPELVELLELELLLEELLDELLEELLELLELLELELEPRDGCQCQRRSVTLVALAVPATLAEVDAELSSLLQAASAITVQAATIALATAEAIGRIVFPRGNSQEMRALDRSDRRCSNVAATGQRFFRASQNGDSRPTGDSSRETS
ncbi:MAG TPA: hypothetical protein VMI92_07960 [Steroidobacteraceae bacterium]|nr:hypothetical protein [Steroidobacteraceae bacterium]